MPELPELEVVAEVLERRVLGCTIRAVETILPGAAIVIRDLVGAGFAPGLTGRQLNSVARRGKYIAIGLNDGNWLVVNPKLTGRLQLATSNEKRMPKTWTVLALSSGQELRYFDQKSMGQIYLTRSLSQIPEFDEMGPEPFEISAADFVERAGRRRGEIKGVLTDGTFVAGIGNAYADEILWTAGINPFLKRTQLRPDQLLQLHGAMLDCLSQSTVKVREEMGENIHLKPRDFMAVHMKAGEQCPRCGTRISLVKANQRITNYCQKCQPGGLFDGMRL